MQNVKIPQNVRVEDKIVGPFSLKQLILVGLGGGFSYILSAGISRSVGYVPALAHMFIWLPAILAVAFALVRINDLSLFRCCLLIIEMMSKPRRRAMQPRQGLIINIQTRPGKRKKEIAEEHGAETNRQISVDELRQFLSLQGQAVGQISPQRLDTIAEGGEEEAHRKRIDALWETAKKARTGVAASPLQVNVDSVRSPRPQ